MYLRRNKKLHWSSVLCTREQYRDLKQHIKNSYPDGWNAFSDQMARHYVIIEDLRKVALTEWTGKEFHGVPVDLILLTHNIKNKNVYAYSMEDFLMRIMLTRDFSFIIITDSHDMVIMKEGCKRNCHLCLTKAECPYLTAMPFAEYITKKLINRLNNQ